MYRNLLCASIFVLFGFSAETAAQPIPREWESISLPDIDPMPYRWAEEKCGIHDVYGVEGFASCTTELRIPGQQSLNLIEVRVNWIESTETGLQPNRCGSGRLVPKTICLGGGICSYGWGMASGVQSIWVLFLAILLPFSSASCASKRSAKSRSKVHPRIISA